MTTEDWTAGRDLPTTISAELDSTPMLVQINKTLWVNPSTVTHAAAAGSDTEIGLVNGGQVHIMQPLHEVVALLNGSA